MKRKNCIAKACFFILVFLVSIISCEVGLGSAVDTEAPKLSIESPTVDSVIRDKFAIKGTWSDDGSIDSIVAELKRTDGYGTTIKLEGTNTVNETIEGKSGTWEVIVDYKEADLKDGTYQATVTIKDKGKHETSQNTTFTIDNTPPVLILTKPNSKPTDETLSVYGQRLFLEGSIADTTKETFIEVYFYKDEACTELLNTIKTQAIAPTDVNSNNGKLATFLDINYDKIYETEGLEKDDPARKHGAQPVYAKFKIYDSAIRIPVEGEKTKEDDEGNYTEYFYVSKDLSSKITLSKSSGGYGLAPIDLYNILNGSDSLKSNVRSATDIAAILTSLDSVKNSTSKFSINPDNSPYFTVSGLKTLTKSGSDFEEAANGYYVKNGTITLEVSVFMGSDSIELVDDDDFYVYLQECDDYGNPIESKPKIKLYSKYKEVQQQGQLKKTYYKIGGKEGHKTTTGAYVFSIPMNKTLKFDPDAGDAGIVSIDGLNYGSNYVLIVNGKDAEGNPIVPYDNGYGFKFSSSGNGPVLTVESPSFITTNTENLSADAIKTPLKVEFLIDTTESSLEIKRGEADLSDPSWDNALAIQNENGVSQGPITNFTPPATVQAFDYYPVSSTVQDGQTYKLMYFVYDGVNEEPSTKKITYTVDNTPPVIGGITIEGSAYDTNKWYQKNTLALVVTVTDAGSKVYKVEYKTDELNDWTALTKDGEYFKGTITFLENGERTLVLRATDNVGNISSETSKIIKIDTGKPDLEGYFYKINGGDINELDSIVYVNPSKTITVYGKYGNKNSGVKELQASIKSEENEPKTPTGWTIKYSTSEITKNTTKTELAEITTGAKTYNDITDKTSIKSWVATFTPEAGNFKISGENNMQDANGALAKTEKELFEIIADTTSPTFENIDLSDSYFYKSNTEEKYYYINNKKSDGTNKTFKFSGVAKDDYGLSSVSLKIGNEDLPVQRSAAWSFENLTFNNADGGSVNCSLTAVDKAGNDSVPYEFTIVFDQSAPSAKHEIDGKEKDLYVRIGDDDNDDVEATDTIDKKVGKKYSKGSYGNDVTIQLRGNFDDGQNGSGVSMIYYKVYASEAAILNEIPGASDITQLTPANLDTLKDKVIESPKAGKFTPLDENDTKRVFYNVKVTKATDDKDSIVAAEEAKGGTWFSNPKWTITDPLAEGYSTQVGYYKFYKNIETSFNTTITGLSEGNNFVVFVAQDNVGNAKVDYAVIPKPTESNPNATETYPCYSLNVDTVVPQITSDHEDDIIFTNCEGSVELSGTVSDADAGIRSLEFFIGNTALKEKNGDITVSLSDTHNGNWTATIPASKFTGLATPTVYLLATDDAGKGNSTKSGVGTIKIDTTEPIITVSSSSPKAGTTVNKDVIFSGTVSDGNGAGVDEAPILYWKTDSSADWSELIKGSEENPTALTKSEWKKDAGEWSFTIDTTVVPNGTTAYFTVCATDKSGTGNVGYSTDHELTIDQNSDRPIITLSQIKKDTEVTLKTKTVYGSIKDDDGTLDKLWYWYAKPAPISDNLPIYDSDNSKWTNLANWNEIPIDGNSWSIDSPELDGETTWYFAVADATHEVFAAVGDKPLKQPYLKYLDKTENLDGDSAGVKFKYDTNPPTPTYLYLYRAPENTTTALTTIAADTSLPWTTENNIAFGAKHNVLYAKVIVEEGTEMRALSGSNGSLPMSSPISISYKNQAGNSPLTYDKILEDKGTGENEGKYTYYLGPLVMDTTEACEFKITVEDAVGNKGYISRNIIVDNTAPDSIKNVKPTKQEAVTGVVNFRGSVSDNENGSGILYETNDNNDITAYGVEWYIPTCAQVEAGASAITTGWAYPTSMGTASWEIEFENLGTIIGYNSSSYEVGNDYKNFQTGTDTGLYDIPVWFRLTDDVGNVGYITNNSIRYNPNADRPVVQITYPTHEAGKDYVTMGGTINISGMANDDDGITAVYLQFDMDGDEIFENGEGVSGTPFTNPDIVDIPNTNPVQRGVLANGTKSWYKTLSINSIDSNSIIKVRAISIEKDSEKNSTDLLVSAWSDILNIKVNNDVPTFSNIKLKKFDTAPTSATLSGLIPSGEMDYASDMFIKGSDTNWYLTGEINVANTTTISSVLVTGAASFAYTNDNNSGNDTLISYTTNGNKKCYFAIPVTLTNIANSVWETTINATDNTTGQPQSNRFLAVINLDRTAPNFTDTKTVGGKDEIKLYKNAYGSSGVELSTASSDNYVQNSNGSFTLTGRINEEGSGFERLVFYFERKGSGTDTADRIYNPMVEHGTNNQANRTNLSSSQTNGSVHINSAGLPALYLTGVTRTNNLTITSSSLKDNKNIRKGGLVKIGDVYRLIDNIDNRDVDGTITFTPGCDTSFTTAEFIYAMVIDNNGESTNSNGTLKNDDGDGMIESFTKSGTNYIWDANIDSKHIPDGPIEIHCVVFDKAGNSCHGYTTTKVSNNPPRITSVMFGTDLNADTNYDINKEFKTYYVSTKVDGTGNKTVGSERWDLEAKIDDTNYWTAKSGLVVIPEFVGGTGTIYYKYSKSTGENAEGLTSAATGTLTGTPTIKELSASDEHIRNGENQATLNAASGNTTGAIILATGTADSLTTISKTTGEISSTYTHPNIYSFSFWDSTEGCTPGVDSQWSVLNAKFKQDLVDDTPPTGTITPFYWKSLTENSVYTSKAVEEISSVADLEGHIELEDDLPNTFTSGNSNKELDRDPKVSGKIKIEGYVFDETRIATITVKFADKTVVATYDSINKIWSYTGNVENIYTLTISDPDGPNQQGHAVSWELFADTSAVTTGKVAATEKTITVTVKDAANNSSTPGTNQTGETKTGYYKVDIVPYITGIKTALSDLKKNNPSVYARTALGHYSIAANETITINGFNLTGGTVKLAGGATASYDASGVSLTSLTSAKSGSMSIVVNEVESLNNSNNDDGHGSYDKTVNLTTNPIGDKTIFTNYYNRQPNGDNNNRLTDDVVVDIWEIDSNAAVPFNNTGKIIQPVMKINPVTDQLGFAFASSSGYFSMPGKTIEAQAGSSNWGGRFAKNFRALTDYSYTYWSGELNEFESVGFAYDSFGHSYGTAAGGNLNAGTGTRTDFFDLFTDRWGKGWGDISNENNWGRHKSSKSGYNAIRLEPTGITLEDGSNVLDKGRIRKPSLVTATHGATEDTGDTSVYLAYYDTLTGEIRFRLGNTSDKANNEIFYPIGSYSSGYYSGFANLLKQNNSLSDGNRINIFSSNDPSTFVAGPFIVQNYVQNTKFQLVNEAGTIINEDYTNYYFQLVPEQSKGNFGTFYDRWGTDPHQNQSNIGKDNYNNVAVIAGIPGREAGDYFSLGVIPGSSKTTDTVFFIWYDELNATLYYSYATDYTTEDNIKNNKTAAGWSSKIRVFPENSTLASVGEYCQIIADANGGVHIAAYDPSNFDLVYAYLPSEKAGKPTATSDFKSYVVDSSGIVGDSLTIDVAINSEGKAIPTIGYYCSSAKRPKMAYIVDTDNENSSGSITDCFTGVWECTYIPTTKSLDFTNMNLVNLGMIKDSEGNLKESATTLSSEYENFLQTKESYYGAHWGIKYGNGTNNSVLGYVVKMSSSLMHIETAQMK